VGPVAPTAPLVPFDPAGPVKPVGPVAPAGPDKLVTHNIRPFYFLIFVRFADFINCQIVKWLKSPNGANIVGVVLSAVVLTAIDEILAPRAVAVVAEEVVGPRRTPIVVRRKISNS